MNIEKKYCGKCNLYLPTTDFKKLKSVSALKKYKDGYYWCCNSCYRNMEWVSTPENVQTDRKMRRRWKLLRRVTYVESKYGLKEEDYLSMINSQNNLCAICHIKQEGKILCVDHDHKTGKVRGLLCSNCNAGIGYFKDNVQFLENAIVYLKKDNMN